MNQLQHEIIASRWTRLGAIFNVRMADETADLEYLLLDTARVAHRNSRLFSMSVTWLCLYGDFVAKHRLARLIRDELEGEYQPVMGLLLDYARIMSRGNTHRFNLAIAACKRAKIAAPLFDVDRANAAFVEMARKHASRLSNEWGRWMEDFELKTDAMRPAAWIVQNNPGFRERADFKGDLRVSILEELRSDPKTGASESSLAAACNATRSAIRHALAGLVAAGRIVRRPEHNRMATSLANV